MSRSFHPVSLATLAVGARVALGAGTEEVIDIVLALAPVQALGAGGQLALVVLVLAPGAMLLVLVLLFVLVLVLLLVFVLVTWRRGSRARSSSAAPRPPPGTARRCYSRSRHTYKNTDLQSRRVESHQPLDPLLAPPASPGEGAGAGEVAQEVMAVALVEARLLGALVDLHVAGLALPAPAADAVEAVPQAVDTLPAVVALGLALDAGHVAHRDVDLAVVASEADETLAHVPGT